MLPTNPQAGCFVGLRGHLDFNSHSPGKMHHKYMGVQAVTLLLSSLRIMFFSGNHTFNLIEPVIEPLPLFM